MNNEIEILTQNGHNRILCQDLFNWKTLPNLPKIKPVWNTCIQSWNTDSINSNQTFTVWAEWLTVKKLMDAGSKVVDYNVLHLEWSFWCSNIFAWRSFRSPWRWPVCLRGYLRHALMTLILWRKCCKQVHKTCTKKINWNIAKKTLWCSCSVRIKIRGPRHPISTS